LVNLPKNVSKLCLPILALFAIITRHMDTLFTKLTIRKSQINKRLIFFFKQITLYEGLQSGLRLKQKYNVTLEQILHCLWCNLYITFGNQSLEIQGPALRNNEK